jgi:hypothetical protein
MAPGRRPVAQGLLIDAPIASLRRASVLLLAAACTACVGDRRTGGPADAALAADSTEVVAASLVPTGPTSAGAPAESDARPAFERPANVRGVYLTAWSAGSSRRLEQLIELARRTEVNAFVIDIKDASGYVSHDTQLPLAHEIGATGERRIRDLRGLLKRLEAERIWPIARIVVVQDPLLAAARPDLAAQDASGLPWRDGKGIVWLNPVQRGVWDYHLDLAEEVVGMGFPEIQWDYVRFPDAPKSELAQASFPGLSGPKEEVIRSFLGYARARLDSLAHDVVMTADVFGVTTSVQDVGIGQVWERFIDRVDVALPMVYPSHYYRGSFGYQRPNFYPYEVVRAALESAQEKSAAVASPGRIRPWLQDFDLGQPAYDAPEVRAQIQAAYDVGIDEWVLWNPGSRYTEAALAPADGWNGNEPRIRIGDQVVPMSQRFDLLAQGASAPRRASAGTDAPSEPERPPSEPEPPASEPAPPPSPVPDASRPRVLDRDSLRAWLDSIQR